MKTVSPERAQELLEGELPQVGLARYSNGSIEFLAGGDVTRRIPLPGARFEVVERRDWPEVKWGSVLTLIGVPAVWGIMGDGCAIATALLGALFVWVMFIKGHYLIVTDELGEVFELYIPDDDAHELDLFLLRLTTEQLGQ